MKNTEYKDVFDFGAEALSMDNIFNRVKFPTLNEVFTTGENIRGMTNVSPLATVKFFNQTSDDIVTKYYPDAAAPVRGTFIYIPDTGSDLTSDIKTTVKDFYYYGIEDINNFAFKVIIFSSTDATKLKECFEVSRPEGREILIFVEDNTTDSVSGTYGSIKISEDVLSFLNSNKRLAYDLYDNTEIYKEIKSVVPELSNDQIKSLLKNGYIEDYRIDIAKTYLKVASYFSSGISLIHPGLGILTNDVLRGTTSSILEKIITLIEKARFEENRWQPKPPRLENGEIDGNYRYDPVISSDKNANGTINLSEIRRFLKTMLTNQNNMVRITLNIKDDFQYNSQPKGLLELLYKLYLDAYYIMHKIASDLEEIADLPILKYGAQTYNALLCGVWNGLVDAVSGLFAMVKMIYDGITMGKDFVQNIDKYLPTLLEQFDEVIQAIKNINFTEIAKYVYSKLKEINLTFDPVACAYFVGYAYGFIISLVIEIIVGAVVSGGVLDIPIIIQKLEEALFGIFRLGWGLAKGAARKIRTFSKFVVKSVQDLIERFKEFLKFLQKGKSEILKAIDKTFSKINEKIVIRLKEAFYKDTKTDELFRKISQKFDLFGKQILNTNELKKLRLYLKEELGIELEIVSRKNPSTKALWEKMALGHTDDGNRVLGMFKATTGKSRKFGMTLEGPKLYVLDEAYAYTVEHELKHAKLWYKMTKEFPELEGQFNNLSQRLHEEYVLSELIKDGKWGLEDLLLDLETINNKFRYPLGLSKVDLDYFKTWKLNEHLNY